MEAPVDATLPYGLVPLVVMEFLAITVGGGFSGTSGESSSFRYGALDSTVYWIQIILADGTIEAAYKKDKVDLFWGATSGFGTFGVVTLLEVQLKDAKPFVELRYKVTCGAREMVEVIKDECDKMENDYVDDIVYSKFTAAICIGRLVDKIPILDPLLRVRVMYSAGHTSRLFDYYMVQDVGVPYDHALEFQDWLDKEHGMYSLWICPLRVRRDDQNSDYGLHAEFGKPGAADLVNFGIWGSLQGNRRDVIRHNRALEPKAEFWSQYDKKSYDELRAKYGASNLPNVYDKVKVHVDEDEKHMASTAITGWPLRGLWGVVRAVLGSDYLLQEESDN
ncbi:uncharacterized protein FIESC28_10280 [Fusarium coffeatum]|uniref:FAD-binding PCMH-type domain-containing protein n=1 Tax=Fusarium coffeatum TaxID=231269 RepID=A0A366QTT7_9HYPO|nr:uncharacterized protein FIESC28_10280 [Fusarium coffeatum]RBR08334.1 hypothetical protein FIESC28_10280 [Fusarium coffeatum]